MNYKLIATDLDGTLLNDNKEISLKDIESIHKFIDNGYIFAFSTGRPLKTSRQFFMNIKRDIPLILYNGAYITTSLSNKLIYKNPIGYDVLYDIFMKYHDRFTFLIWANEELYSNNIDEYTEEYTRRLHFDPKVVNIEDLKEKEIVKAIIVNRRENLLSVQKEASLLFPKADFYFSSYFLLEIVRKGVTKEDGVKRLCNYLNIDINDAIAMGDEENDIPMIKAAGMGVAVKNASDNVKAVASYITSSDNNNSPVTEVINKFFKE